MPAALLYLAVFVEGFCSLGAEVIALRRLLPHVGSAIIVTAPTIGLFLLALALGYGRGARVDRDYRKQVARNFLICAGLVGAGLSAVSIDTFFGHLPTLLAYALYVGGVLCPVAWLLGQTVPILTNLMRHERTGEASGMALYWSTLGSFLGAITLSLLIMQWLGVSAAILLCASGLFVGAMALYPAGQRPLLPAVLLLPLMLAPNLKPVDGLETAYAEYRVVPVNLAGFEAPRALMVNQSLASLIDEGEPPHYARYIRHLRQILLEDLAFTDREILVLGAGGFTLSHREPKNRYTFVDIDPAIRDYAERAFLREPAKGTFIADDARRYIATTDRRYSALVVDVFSAHTSIPGHLVTREFWMATRRVLETDGVLLVNLILDGRLESDYARNLLTTIESVYGRCAVDVLQKGKPLANVEVSCFASSLAARPRLYADERNAADFDHAALH